MFASGGRIFARTGGSDRLLTDFNALEPMVARKARP
jgi:hypothetical protein